MHMSDNKTRVAVVEAEGRRCSRSRVWNMNGSTVGVRLRWEGGRVEQGYRVGRWLTEQTLTYMWVWVGNAPPSLLKQNDECQMIGQKLMYQISFKHYAHFPIYHVNKTRGLHQTCCHTRLHTGPNDNIKRSKGVSYLQKETFFGTFHLHVWNIRSYIWLRSFHFWLCGRIQILFSRFHLRCLFPRVRLRRA